ncbi:hypothetical protein GF373_09980, partial [bacterium]|nr:hypothetical protein [bacterium]
MRTNVKSYQYSLLLGFFVLICLVASAAAEVLPGQVMVDPKNPFWLVYNRDLDDNGRLDPFFLCGPGDPEGFLYRGKRNKDGTRDGDQAKIIKRLQQHGGNCIYMIAVRTHGGDAWKDERRLPDIYPDKKHNPWVGQDPKKGLNEAILAQWEEWFTLMDEQGIVIYFFFYDDAIKVGKTLGWPLSEDGNLHPREKAFIQALVNRFEHHKHLIWCVMEEGQEIGAQWKRHISQIAAAIREADDHRHPIATHQLGGNRFFHAADRNLDQFAIQTNADAVGNSKLLHEWLVQIREKTPGLYSLNMSEDKIQGELCEKGDRVGIRKRSWASAMAGAYVMVIGMDGAETPKQWLGDCR